MPLPLDTLLFWAGLGLLIVGLFIFVTGKTASEDEKSQSNRFEAFGIKIDVNNPSLILIILGVVMMLAPRILPQQTADLAPPGTTASSIPPPSSTQVLPKQESFPAKPEITQQESAIPPVQPIKKNSPKLKPEPVATPTASATQPIAPPVPQATTQQISKPPAKVIEKQISKPPVKITKKQILKPAPVLTQPQPPEPLAKTAETLVLAPSTVSKPIQAPAKPSLTVLVQADADRRVGIDKSAIDFGRQVSAELINIAEDIFGNEAEIKQQEVKTLRQILKKTDQPYLALCRQVGAERLLLADLEIPFALSDIDSAYWPDLRLNLVDCDTGRKKKKIKNHLNPTVRDRFPFQQAIKEVAANFLDDYRHLVVK
ncbi:MAG: hypothetical protein OI74_06160 [Gammaproteobacteria bacterium (ex Lamellibrachia satsuma)]|nr:MAG: hypothetical protein HPY30_00165 [Gammaproteobacteria bacterium (ex Lamellibrachia satsuma)]RRS34048.1 MAG: hypothetical protein OI74_06160 [Gammaproteobacteria bacterium (ex Lamellibrachia satsuma)]RRS35809.1 MAG: hypothetical protein NV67_09410 [Gammaproteobacteria bacterium (ex Lamellibrachia satsuma)]